MSIDVYELIDEKLLHLYKTLRRKSKHVNLLLIQTDYLNNFHFFWIKNLPWLFKKFTVLEKSFLDESQKSENQSEIMNEVEDIIVQKANKLKTVHSVETSCVIFDHPSNDLQRPKLQQTKEWGYLSENLKK